MRTGAPGGRSQQLGQDVVGEGREGCASRNHDVSLVVSASTTWVLPASRPSRTLDVSTHVRRSRQRGRAAAGGSPQGTPCPSRAGSRYACAPAWPRSRRCPRNGHARLPRCGARRRGGRPRDVRGGAGLVGEAGRATAPAFPRPPRSLGPGRSCGRRPRRAARAVASVGPIPVSTTPEQVGAVGRTAEGNRMSTAGRQKFTGGPWFRWSRTPPRVGPPGGSPRGRYRWCRTGRRSPS